MNNTIIAAASGVIRSGVILVRASGPNVRKLIECLTQKAVPEARSAVLRNILDANNQIIDSALVLYFQSPNSFTGEDIAEFHLHGSRAVLSAFLNAALATGLCIMAKPGEFTRRAFENGKMDLSSAEGLADLIDAETEAQRKQAYRQMAGELGVLALNWRKGLIDIMAQLEAYIDFPDEDLPGGLRQIAANLISDLLASLKKHLLDSKNAQRIRDGFYIAIIGAPNSGKSSLLNAIARKDAAIVSPIAGTTRDVVEISIVLNGQLFWLADTAGLRDAVDEIEKEGILRALKRAQSADLRIGLVSQQCEVNGVVPHLIEGDIIALSKSDIALESLNALEGEIMSIAKKHNFAFLSISSKTGAGIDNLESKIGALSSVISGEIEAAPITRARHEEAIKSAIFSLENAQNNIDAPSELLVEDLRLAARHLGSISGNIGVEDVLDKVFATFCIGK